LLGVGLSYLLFGVDLRFLLVLVTKQTLHDAFFVFTELLLDILGRRLPRFFLNFLLIFTDFRFANITTRKSDIVCPLINATM
jgi:hypothetical protein